MVNWPVHCEVNWLAKGDGIWQTVNGCRFEADELKVIGVQNPILDGPVAKFVIGNQGAGINQDNTCLSRGEVAEIQREFTGYLACPTDHGLPLPAQILVKLETHPRIFRRYLEDDEPATFWLIGDVLGRRFFDFWLRR